MCLVLHVSSTRSFEHVYFNEKMFVFFGVSSFAGLAPRKISIAIVAKQNYTYTNIYIYMNINIYIYKYIYIYIFIYIYILFLGLHPGLVCPIQYNVPGQPHF